MNAGVSNPLLNQQSIANFLNHFDSASRRRGKHYYANGAVLQVGRGESDLVYQAVVRGSKDYEVSLEYDPEGLGWEAECSCPLEFECKHAYAAMLALQANASRLEQPLPKATVTKRGRKTATVESNIVKLRPDPEPPVSPLFVAVTQGLGRELALREAEYLKRVQLEWKNLPGRRSFYVNDLQSFSPTFRELSWEVIELWPKPPKDDYEFWQYIVWELRRRGAQFPAFMLPATDLSKIEPIMREWEREKEIEKWRQKLRINSAEVYEDALDFRLMFQGEHIKLQWKKSSEALFGDLTNKQYRKISQGFSESQTRISPESLPLWLCVHNAYGLYDPTSIRFGDPYSRHALNRIFRIPAVVNSLVSSNGEPLSRPVEPLRYAIDEAADVSQNYVLKLVQHNGESAPAVRVVLPGRPTLYVTDAAVFEGPPAHKLDVTKPLAIPAPALESLSGINFIQTLGLPLPQRVAGQIRHIPAKVTLSCKVASARTSESVMITVTCKTQGRLEEICGPNGWVVLQGFHAVPQQAEEVAKDGFILLPDESTKRLFPEKLEPLKAKWDYNAFWRVSLSKAFPERFAAWLQTLPPDVEVELDKQLATLRDAPVSGSVELDIEEAGVDWFDLRVALKVTELNLTPEELKLLLNAKGGFVRLGKKGWRRLQLDMTAEESEHLAHLGLNTGDFTAEPQRLHALQLANPAARSLLPEAQVERIERRASEIKTRVVPPVPPGISADLRPYQLDGFHFLSYLSANRFGGVLADDMGLGKTLQAMTWLSWLCQNGSASPEVALLGDAAPNPPISEGISAADNGQPLPVQVPSNGSQPTPVPTLIVCPKSVMDNWQTEAARFWPGTRVKLWRGEEAAALPEARASAELVVINYSQLRSLSPEIAQYHWHAVILDEAQYIKNPDSQTAQAARTLKADHRLALTGTPIENRLLDLWSIFSFAMPGVLGNRAYFMRVFNQQDDPFARQRLAARVRPFLLRRTKAQVAKDLPDKVEEDLVCEMEGQQKTLYRAEFKAAQQRLLNVNSQKELNEQRFHFLTSLLRLRQICCHPGLVDAELINAESTKVNALMDMIESIIDEGHKVLVFSQFVTMLDILRLTVIERGWKHFYLAGDTENRGELVADFQKHEGGAVFLISLKAGGFGLNLTAASYVVLFDPWWNPAVETQAIDRTHRIGQTSKVMAYRLLIKDSIEQKIRQLQRSKAALAQDVLGEERFSQSLTLDDLRFLFEG